MNFFLYNNSFNNNFNLTKNVLSKHCESFKSTLLHNIGISIINNIKNNLKFK